MSKPSLATAGGASLLYRRIRHILKSARRGAARSVNSAQVLANWLVGREIVEEEQRGKERAAYGKRLLEGLAGKLRREFGEGYSAQNLRLMRQFYLQYPPRRGDSILYPLRRESDKSQLPTRACPRRTILADSQPGSRAEIRYALRSKLTVPAGLSPDLSWSHYRMLIRVEDPRARSFYEIETVKNAWSGRELERQVASLLFERLARSRDKKGVLRLARRGHVVQRPADLFKDPMVMEFLGLPESPSLHESDLERALLNNLQAFLLELGSGFAFVARQQRITIDGDHFNIDLVFYHTHLKCHLLIDLKIGKLTHADIGQMELYTAFYDAERRPPGDGPTLGLMLCTDKNDAMVRYMLGKRHGRTMFASRYRLHLPTEAELRTEVRKSLDRIGTGIAGAPAARGRR